MCLTLFNRGNSGKLTSHSGDLSCLHISPSPPVLTLLAPNRVYREEGMARWRCFTRRTCECVCTCVCVCMCVAGTQTLSRRPSPDLWFLSHSGAKWHSLYFFILKFLLTKCISNVDFFFFFWRRCATWRVIDRQRGDFYFFFVFEFP